MVARIALGDTPCPTAHHPVTHGSLTHLAKLPGTQTGIAHQTPEHSPHPRLISPQERIKATGEDVHYKRSLRTFFNVVEKCSRHNGE